MDCKIWEACRATSAATSFFEPITIGPFNQQFSDGATSCNNPVRQVLGEARKIWSNTNERTQCLISIGTGVPMMSAFGSGIKSVIETLKGIVTDTEATAEEFKSEHKHSGLSGSYFRFNVQRGLEEVGLEEYTAVSRIASATTAYLQSYETLEEFENCVRRLREQASPQYHSRE
jgi:hypothetical protein